MVIDIVWFWRNKLCFPASLSVIVDLLPLGVESEAIRLILIIDYDNYSNSPCWRWLVDFPFSVMRKGIGSPEVWDPESSGHFSPALRWVPRSCISPSWQLFRCPVLKGKIQESGDNEQLSFCLDIPNLALCGKSSGWYRKGNGTRKREAVDGPSTQGWQPSATPSGSYQQHCPRWPPHRGPPLCYTACGYDVTHTDLWQSPQSL